MEDTVFKSAMIVAMTGLTLLVLSAVLDFSGVIRRRTERLMVAVSVWLFAIAFLTLMWSVVLGMCC
jgi:hypothetical protein